MTAEPDPVAAYKLHLRGLIDRRPSGTRRKLAEAFGTHPSFISQILSPALRVPLPAQHVPTLLRICHFSPEERQSFLALYTRAHPPAEAPPPVEEDALVIPLPAFASRARREEVAALIRDFARRVIALAEDDRREVEEPREEAHQRRR